MSSSTWDLRNRPFFRDRNLDHSTGYTSSAASANDIAITVRVQRSVSCFSRRRPPDVSV
jgi:hypothetical protein